IFSNTSHSTAQLFPLVRHPIARCAMNGLRAKPCDQEVKMSAPCQFAIFHAQTPWKIGEVNPKLLGRLSQPSKEHIEASSCRHHFIPECECPEQLPRLLYQYVDFGCFHQ